MSGGREMVILSVWGMGIGGRGEIEVVDGGHGSREVGCNCNV